MKAEDVEQLEAWMKRQAHNKGVHMDNSHLAPEMVLRIIEERAAAVAALQDIVSGWDNGVFEERGGARSAIAKAEEP